MTRHILKIHPTYFDAVKNGIKGFEIRKNDRDYCVGDTLCLREYDPSIKAEMDAERYTGRDVNTTIIYVITSIDFPDGIKEGYCILGIRVNSE